MSGFVGLPKSTLNCSKSETMVWMYSLNVLSPWCELSSCLVRRSLVDALPVECMVVSIVQQLNDLRPSFAALKVG